MAKNTKETDKIVKEKLKYIGLDLDNVSSSLLNMEKVSFRPLKMYEDNNYKVYRYVDIEDIEILITPADRLDDLHEKFKKALPLSMYLNSEEEKLSTQYNTFLDLVENLNVEKLEKIEEEQKEMKNKVPYEIKYNNNFTWQIYYSDIDNKYFMLYSSNESNSEALFYLIKKKLSKKSEKIYVPISHLEYSGNILKKSEITDLENYLWFFTKEWPNIYEVYNNKNELSIEIIGEVSVYENIKSMYKISIENKEKAQDIFKLIKALFILQSNDEVEYDFDVIENKKGSIDFCYNSKKITYENLSEFIKNEVELKQEKLEKITKENVIIEQNVEILKETVNKQKEEFLQKEKQIANFLECKKTFFGRVKYYFKKGKKVKKKVENLEEDKDKEKENTEIKEIKRIEIKDLYTIEDLLKICNVLGKEEVKFKNMQMDIKALKNKSESLDRKIKNATMYIDEIESHKKSIFEFWKFTNKDESNLLTQGETEEEETVKKIKKVFNFKQDIETFSEKVDTKQRGIFSKNECDAVFAIRNDIGTFNILNKEKNLKKDDNIIEKTIKQFKQEYMENLEIIEKKDFDIFGNVAQDKTKIKTLKNNKHREIEKDKFKILDINPNTTLEEYKENIDNYRNLLNEVYGKMVSPYDIYLYKVSEDELDEKCFEIFELNAEEEIDNSPTGEKLNLYKINVKEKMPVIFYTNIMFFDNMNKTLPVGMDIETKTLIDLSKFNLKLVDKKEFYINKMKDEFKNNVQLFEVYEYDLEYIK